MLKISLSTNLSICMTQIMVQYDKVDGGNKLVQKLLKVKKS